MNKESIQRLSFAVNITLSLFMLIFTLGVIVPHFSKNNTVKIECEEANTQEALSEETAAAAVKDTKLKVTTEAPPTEENTENDDFSDIKKLQEEYKAQYGSTEAYGKVKEQFFTTDAATDIIGKVAIRNCTETKNPDFEALLSDGIQLSVDDISEPYVLIYHTHTTESYLMLDNGVFYKDYKTRSTDSGRNMIRVGNEICSELEKAGIGVIHDTGIYDESYNGAYSRSRKSVEKYLEEYPSIQITLDIHRDAIYYSETSCCKPTAVINGEKAAQIMIITGAAEGNISDFDNWENNLKLALALQKNAQEKYEGLMKPVYFCQRRYNMDLAACSLLLEIGSDANTLEEACRSAKMIGNVLAEIIKEQKSE